eukprot:gene5529-9346_t
MNHEGHGHRDSFYIGLNYDTMIFSFLKNDDNLTVYLFTLVMVFMMSVFLEFLGYLLHEKMYYKNTGMKILYSILKLSSYAFHLGLSYLIMLALMSYNFGIFIAVVSGHVFGFSVFSLKNSIE